VEEVVMRKTEFARCVFVPRDHVENLPAGSTVFDVSSYADAPYCELSPRTSPWLTPRWSGI
jgi:hypothetical protein